MLAVFEKTVGKPPEEFSLPSLASSSPKNQDEIAEIFRSSWPDSVQFRLPNRSFMALTHDSEILTCPRSFVAMDDIFCIFVGTLQNVSELGKHYGLTRLCTEATVVVEAYKVLRDRAPYPPDQVVKDFEGKFAFILCDTNSNTLFAARDRDGSVELFWGAAGDGSLVCSDNLSLMREACGKSLAAFPPGCIFISSAGLMSFDHPFHKVRAVAHEDNDGHVTAVIFQMDRFKRLHSIPRTGSATSWAGVALVEGEETASLLDGETVDLHL